MLNQLVEYCEQYLTLEDSVMVTKISRPFGLLNPKHGARVSLGFRKAFIDSIACSVVLVLVLSFTSQLPAQQNAKDQAQQVDEDEPSKKRVRNDAKKKTKKQSRRKSPYFKMINGAFTHIEEPLFEDGLPLWIYGDARMMRGRKEFALMIVLHGRRNKVEPGTVFKPQGIATAWAKSPNQETDPCFVVQPYYPPKGGWEKIPEQLDATVAHLMENLPVDSNRVYLMGFSNGAQGTYQTLARNPDQYAAAITVAGPVGIKSVVGKIKTPIRAWVGENDDSLKKNVRTIALAKALKEDGVDIELVVVEGAGHACYRVPLHDPAVHNWLFSQTRETEKPEK